jgi:hypothetical protein
MTTLTPEQALMRKQEHEWIRARLQEFSDTIQKKIAEGEKDYTQFDVEKLYEAYVKFIDRFAYVVKDIQYGKYGQIVNEWSMRFKNEPVRPEGELYPFHEAGLSVKFFYRVKSFLGEKNFGDERDIIIDSMKSIGNSDLLVELFCIGCY